MFISQALVELQGRPDLFAWRDTGEVIQVTPHLRIVDVRTGRPRIMVFKIGDLMSNAWTVGDGQKLAASLTRKLEARAV